MAVKESRERRVNDIYEQCAEGRGNWRVKNPAY
jgi:hypothetical protein